MSGAVVLRGCQVFVRGTGAGGKWCFHCKREIQEHPSYRQELWHPAGPFLYAPPEDKERHDHQ